MKARFSLKVFIFFAVSLSLAHAGALDGIAGGLKNLRAQTPPAAQSKITNDFPTGYPRFAFSDETKIDSLLIDAIGKTNSTLDLALFGITLDEVANAIVKAQEKGVKVRVVMNQNHTFGRRTSPQVELLKGKVEMRSLRGTWTYGVMHNKISIYDGKMMETGSYNWTVAATNDNYENVMFTSDKEMVSGYQNYFDYMWSLARPVADGPRGEVAYGSYPTPTQDPQPSISFNSAVLAKYGFSPLGGAEATLLAAVNASQKTIEIASYSFYSKPLVEALIAAHERGVAVHVVTDKTMAVKSGLTTRMVKAGIKLKWMKGRAGKGAMHNKFAVFDGKLMESGSHNWTSNAEMNDFENFYVCADSDYVGAFAKKFSQLFALAKVPAENELPADNVTPVPPAPIPTPPAGTKGFADFSAEPPSVLYE